MKTAPIPSAAKLASWEKKAPPDAVLFPPLEAVTRPTVDTAAAAHYLNRQPQTLRGWAAYANGALQCRRINGRLAWPVAELKALLGVPQ